MISAFEITGIILLVIGVGLVVWWYIEAANYDTMLNGVSFVRGVNMIYNPEGSDADNTINMTCPEGKSVCVYQATQICTNPDSNNVEDPTTDPIYAELNDNWGKFNPKTTTDLTSELNSNCGTGAGEQLSDKSSCPAYVFTPSTTTTSGDPFTCKGDIHFIATYTCQPQTLSDGSLGTCQPATGFS